MACETPKERTSCLKLLLGECTEVESTMAAFANQIRNELNVQHCPVEQHDENIEDKCSTMQKYVLTKVESFEAQIQSLLEDVVGFEESNSVWYCTSN